MVKSKGTKLRIAWWNTSLNPPVNKNKINIHTTPDEVWMVLLWLMNRYDIIFCGEFSDSAVRSQVLSCKRTWKFMPMADFPRNGIKMNLGVFVRNSVAVIKECGELEAFNTIVSARREKTSTRYRVGVRIRMKLNAIKSNMEFYVLHWRNYGEANSDFIKDSAALTLCNYVNLSSDFPLKICLGDFNVEPWASSLAKLSSSRSLSYIRKYGGFYNPFWQFLHEDNGSLCYPEHVRLLSNNLMFDQILLYHGLWDCFDLNVNAVIERPKCLNVSKGCHFPIGVSIYFNSKKGSHNARI